MKLQKRPTVGWLNELSRNKLVQFSAWIIIKYGTIGGTKYFLAKINSFKKVTLYEISMSNYKNEKIFKYLFTINALN